VRVWRIRIQKSHFNLVHFAAYSKLFLVIQQVLESLVVVDL
jgi:hypothetical protein